MELEFLQEIYRSEHGHVFLANFFDDLCNYNTIIVQSDESDMYECTCVPTYFVEIECNNLTSNQLLQSNVTYSGMLVCVAIA